MYNSAIKVLKMLEEHGFKAYIVGGFVRDLIINRKSSDIDICTNAKPKEIKEIFKNVILKKEQYGSVTLVINQVTFEITTFRKDLKYENNRLPVKIKYINSLQEDLKRRDFTMNTICMDSNGNIIDMLNAKADLENKIIKTVGPARVKLSEDSLRILRAIRFSTILDFDLDKDLIKYIVKYKKLLRKLSYYRKKEELDKIFSSPNKKKGINLLIELDLLDDLDIMRLNRVQITKDAIGIWTQLNVDKKYSFTNNELEQMKQIRIVSKLEKIDNFVLYQYGLYVCTVACEIRKEDTKIIAKNYMKLPIKNKNEINISAMEICNILSLKPSMLINEIFKDLEKQIINKKIINEKKNIEEYIIKKYKKI